jgi:hypothetical protein
MQLKGPSGFFRFGDVACYGQVAGVTRPLFSGDLFDASQHIQLEQSTIVLPFDLSQSLDNFRYERFLNCSGTKRLVETSWVKEVYYLLRPILPISLRRHLQKMYLRDWCSISFPRWPVDRSVEILLEKLLVLAMQALRTDRLPFIWFWPRGHKACAIMTHDVETTAGRDFCEQLMDIDLAYGITAAFQIVPENRYTVSSSYLKSFRDRGCETNVHGLDHKGNLFDHRETFLWRAKKINDYAKLFGARGFRSPALYRNIDWFQALNFSYDMSVPNVARLEAQRGGCCTVMPYFLPGGMLEIPLTTTEDYTLFHILGDYSIRLWQQQIATILAGSGLMSFIIHPDYILNGRAQGVYKALLEELSRLRSDEDVWVALPGEVDQWWRQRSQMHLIPSGSDWKIEGPGNERARIAYAFLRDEQLVYEV